MATTNPVHQVLVTSGNQAPLAAGNPVSGLAVGQIGVFNYHNNLSLGAASIIGDTREIYLAVGIDPDGIGSLQDIRKSSGQVLQVRNAKTYTVKGYVDDLPKIMELTGFVAKCETDYAIKVELRNSETYMLHGYNQFTKTFNFRTGCCADQCTDCGEGDSVELAQGLVNNINADTDGMLIAELFSNIISATVSGAATANGTLTVTIGSTVYSVPVLNGDTVAVVAGKIIAAVNAVEGTPYVGSATGAAMRFSLKNAAATGTFALTNAGGTGVTVGTIIANTKTVVTDVPAFQAANPGAPLSIRITSVPAKVRAFSSINVHYNKLRSTNILIALVDGFKCNGVITTTQELQFSEGKGIDLQQLEYVAAGWNGMGPYRTYAVTGLAKDHLYLAAAGTNYNVLSLTYDQFSVGGWLEYLNNLETIIGIPCADSTTLTGLVAILDAIFTQFAPMAGDVATMDCTNTSTSTLTDATNGIESLS